MTKPTPSIPYGWYYNDTPGGDGHSHFALNNGVRWTWACVSGDGPLQFIFEPRQEPDTKFGYPSYWKKGRKAPRCPKCWEKHGLQTIVEELLDE